MAEVTALKYKIETIETPDTGPISTYGTLDGGLETMSEAWPKLRQVFSSGGPKSTATQRLSGGRVPLHILNKNPVDMLVVERGHFYQPPKTQLPDPRSKWECILEVTKPKNRPKVVIESWTEKAIGWLNGPMSKGTRTRWSKMGYSSRFQRVDATQVGGAVSQGRLLVVRLIPQLQARWMWQPREIDVQKRPMSNLLIPPGLLPRTRSVPPPIGTLITDT